MATLSLAGNNVSIGMHKYFPAQRAVSSFALLCGFLLSLQSFSAHSEEDELAKLGLPPDQGRDEVEAYCGACHSLKLVVQQGLSRADWEESLVWMVEEQEMEPLEPEDRKLVLDYLAKHVSIEARLRKLNQKAN